MSRIRKNRLYVVYDERAASGNTDDATCLVALGYYSNADRALIAAIRSQPPDTPFVLCSYRSQGSLLTDERIESHHIVVARKSEARRG